MMDHVSYEKWVTQGKLGETLTVKQIWEKGYKAGRASMLKEACEYVMDRGMATGHADTISELLQHFDEQLRENYTKAGRASMHKEVIENLNKEMRIDGAIIERVKELK